ncbi:MAG: tRNA (guanosine(46)-N7)-methyltransferase TrmB [Clostridiales bacterium]|nr:tRNA (guanosine(46)-N7)-methyltransferase TrmB [Clostridiales bacterium]
MRLRRNWQGEAALPDMPGVLETGASSYQPDWAEVFGRKAAIHVEIGVGKGDFILSAAMKYPHIDFIGIEKSWTVLYIAAKKNQAKPLRNLRFLPIDAATAGLFFPSGQIERIYLNFSDPWPKTRHESRRLTAKEKLSLYNKLLKPGGQVHLKTDQKGFFRYSLGMFIREGWSVGKLCKDLYRSGFEENIPTEFEQRFLLMGQPIYRLEAWRAATETGQDV